MTRPYAFVFASGSALRYGEDNEPRFKQLLVDPETQKPIITRTVERLSETCDVVVITPHAMIVEELRKLPDDIKHNRMSIMDVGEPQLMTETLRLVRPAWREKNLGVLGDVWFSERAFKSMEESLKLDQLVFWGRRERSFITGNTGEVFSWQWQKNDFAEMEAAIEAARRQWEDLGFGGYDNIGTPLGCPWQLYRHLNGIPLDQHTTEGGWIDINDFTDDFDSFDRYEHWCKRFAQRIIYETPFQKIGDFDDWRPSAQLKPLEVIVLSTGHSGTGYVAKLLTSAGIPCGHEGVFRDKVIPTPRFRADSSFFAVAHLDHPRAEGAKLVHLTRHPLKVIRSWLYGGTSGANDRWAAAILEKEGLLDFDINDRSPRSLALRWLRWNELIERKAPGIVQVAVEDRKQILSDIGMREKMDSPSLFDDPTYNAKKKASAAPEVTWEMLEDVRGAVEAKAKEYGYA